MATSVGVVLPPERHLAVVDGEQSVVGDGHAVGVSREVAENLFGAAEGRLGVNHPLFATHLGQQTPESPRITQRLQRSVEGQRSGLERGLEEGQELTTEQAAQDPHRQEEPVAAGDPSGPVRGEAAPRNDAVHVGMMQQILAPGVQDGEDADLCAEMLRVGGNLEESLRGRAEEEAVDDLGILKRHGTKRGGKGEDHVEVRGGEQFVLARSKPLGAGSGQTLRAVAVAARVEGDDRLAAGIALVEVTAQRRCPACWEEVEDASLCE